MRTRTKFVLLIVIACALSIFIYESIESVQPVETSEDILVYQENLEKNYTTTEENTIDNPKIIVNPYEISPLTALIMFETKDLTAPTVTIVGKDENTTYKKTFTPNKKHILPIYGLYPDTENEVIITLNGKDYTFHIKTDKLPDDFVLPTDVTANKDELDQELYFVTPSSSGYTAAYDVNGDVRWYLTENMIWDIQRLQNGNIMLSSNRLINPPYYTTGLVEMDLTGKIYYEYVLPGGYHHDVFELENGNLLVASDNFESGTVEDYIVEIERDTGNIVKEIDLKDILPTDQGRNQMATDYDWFHNNAVWYDRETNSITLSGRHQDAVVNIDYNSLELNWIIGSSDGWDESYQEYFLTPTGDDFEWQWAQHASMILPNGDVFIFDNGNNRSKKEENSISASDNYSRGVIYRINQVDQTISQVWQYGKERGSEFYSPYISDVDYLDENHYLIHSGGINTVDGKPGNEPAGLENADSLNSITTEIKDDEVIFEMNLPTNLYRAEKMDLYANNILKLGAGKRLGSMGETTQDGTTKSVLFSHKIDDEYKSHDIKITKETDRLVVTGTFKKGDEVEIILDSIFDKKSYLLRVSKHPYTAMCVDVFNDEETKNGITVTKYINSENISGKKYIYIKINGTIYNTNQYVVF